MLVLLSSLILGACSSNDDDDANAVYSEEVSQAPEWQIDWSNDQERPDWTEPDGSLYENWTILMVQMEEALQPYVSEDDMMAIFINGELRGLASPATTVDGDQTGTAMFLMKAYGNESSKERVNISLQYYSQQLKHLFTLSDNLSLDSDVTTGTDEDYIPQFTFGSAKYPVVKTVNVETLLTAAGVTPATGDMVGAFIGDECRGKVTLSASGITILDIYGRSAGESVTLKYYDATTERLFTIANVMKM
jgi:hypothetical protein